MENSTQKNISQRISAPQENNSQVKQPLTVDEKRRIFNLLRVMPKISHNSISIDLWGKTEYRKGTIRRYRKLIDSYREFMQGHITFEGLMAIDVPGQSGRHKMITDSDMMLIVITYILPGFKAELESGGSANSIDESKNTESLVAKFLP